MSERQEKRLRYNARLEYIAEFTKWLDRKPPRMFFLRWHKWKRQRPVFQDILKEWRAAENA